MVGQFGLSQICGSIFALLCRHITITSFCQTNHFNVLSPTHTPKLAPSLEVDDVFSDICSLRQSLATLPKLHVHPVGDHG
jgi:hypothetical protein